jgi:RNA polymerase sigma factor (sigma-70 family)
MSLSRQAQLRLLAQAREGDQVAAHRLLASFRRPAQALISRTLSGAGVGGDHADEALARAMFKWQATGLSRFKGRSSPQSYFCRIAINCAIDIARQQSRADLTLEDAEPELVISPEAALIGNEADAERERVLAVLRSCVAQLTETYRRPVQLYYLDQAGTCAKCAERLGIAKPAFMQRLSRARKQLASMMRERAQARHVSFSARAVKQA